MKNLLGGGEESTELQFTNDTCKLFLNRDEKPPNRRLKTNNTKKFWILTISMTNGPLVLNNYYNL